MTDSNITGKKDKQPDTAELHRRAEARYKKMQREQGKIVATSISAVDAQRLIQELQIHQIELEMQQEELLRAQEELEASRLCYFDLYDLAPVGYFTISEQGIIIEANLTAATLLGVARGELDRQSLTRFILKEDQNISYRHLKKLFETGEQQMCEMRMLKNNGAPFWVRVDATIAQDAEGARLCRAVISDITERKRIEDELCAHEKQLRTIIDSTPFPMALVDVQDDKIEYWSRSAIDLFGHTALTTPEWYSLAYPEPEYRSEVIERWKPFLEKARLSGKPVNTGEYRVSCHDGSVRVCELYVTFVPGRLIVTFNDITGRKQAESQREAALEEIRKLNEELEHKVNERTEELNKKIAELEELNRSFVGRELRMAELKERIVELEKKEK